MSDLTYDGALPSDTRADTRGRRLNLLAELDTLPAAQRSHYIGGSFSAPSSTNTRSIVNPSTGEALLDVPAGSDADVDRAVRAATGALSGWRACTPQQRGEYLLALADALDRNAESLARLESLQTGKPLAVSRGELPAAADALRYFAGAVRTAQTPAPGRYVTGHLSMIHREPVGVVGAITPWNYPLLMAVWKIAPALAADNTVVLKPSELTPLTTLRLAHLTDGLLPPGTFNVVLGTRRVGQAMAAHPDIAMVSITGSVDSGKAVARTAADTLKRVHLELGGKAPVIAFSDADLDAVADAVTTMGFWNTGQECGSATRVLVHATVHDQLVARILDATSALAIGDPDEGEHVEIGPLISAAHRARVAGYIERAVDRGAQPRHGATAPGRPGWFYLPTVLDRVAEGTEIEQQEVFGPLVTVQTFATEAEALRLANSTRYGLAASVWTRDVARSLRMSEALDFGTVWVNSHLTLATEMPWNGFGQSGYGRDMSSYALDDCTRTKHVMISTDSSEPTPSDASDGIR